MTCTYTPADLCPLCGKTKPVHQGITLLDSNKVKAAAARFVGEIEDLESQRYQADAPWPAWVAALGAGLIIGVVIGLLL